MKLKLCMALLFLLSSCSSIEESQKKQMKARNEQKDVIHRLAKEVHYPRSHLLEQVRDPYPWEVGYVGGYPPITKEVFRCKGSEKNEPKSKQGSSELVVDCGGLRKHSLPVQGGKEFIYPILIDLLNYVQAKTARPVIVTSGHRCPSHHTYVDSSLYQASSKHMIGAEVDFYVAGMENNPQEVIDLMMSYYKNTPCYKNQKEYENFLRLEKVKVDVSTLPWYNKEILIKLYQKNEGRNGDNKHVHPYISLQVRFDREKNEKIIYSWEKAFNGYMRY